MAYLPRVTLSPCRIQQDTLSFLSAPPGPPRHSQPETSPHICLRFRMALELRPQALRPGAGRVSAGGVWFPRSSAVSEPARETTEGTERREMRSHSRPWCPEAEQRVIGSQSGNEQAMERERGAPSPHKPGESGRGASTAGHTPALG